MTTRAAVRPRAALAIPRWFASIRFLHLQSFILSVYVLFSLLHTAATTSVATFEQPHVELRSLGNPFATLARIRDENITTVDRLDALAVDESQSPFDRRVYRHAPLLFVQPERALRLDDTILGLYYTASESTSGSSTATTIRYFLWFSDENGGTPIEQRMALYGHPLDRELVFRVTFLNDVIVAAYYQAPSHRQVRIDYDGSVRPAFQIASDNHNFGRVSENDLERASPTDILALMPHVETERNYRNPDFLALAAREVWLQYGLDMSAYVYVAFYNPEYAGVVTISVRIGGRWNYLHQALRSGITNVGYRRVAVDVRSRPFPGDIDEIRIVTRTHEEISIAVSSVYVLPPPYIEN
jgi:hypothetical protein